MASLQSIMNMDEEVDSPANKKDKDSGTPGARTSHHGYESSSLAAKSSYAIPEDQFESSSTAPGKRRGSSSRVNKSSAAAGSSLSSSTSSRPNPTGRRRSNTGADSMDQSIYAHSQAGPSSSTGHPPSNVPMRPFVTMQSGSDIPVKLTPITGRVSRAKKGVPVHICDTCRPAKTFTRAEHLRRHQLSHQTPGFLCNIPGCDRVFHRKDLLERHQQRHDQEGDGKSAKSGGKDRSRRTSEASQQSLEQGTERLRLQPSASPGVGLSPPVGTPSSMSNLPITPGMTNQKTFQSLNSSPGSSAGKSRSPQVGMDGSYRPPSSGHHGYGGGYTLSSQPPPISFLQHTSTGLNTATTTAPVFTAVDLQPRTTPVFSSLILQPPCLPSLQIPESLPPDLGNHDASTWPSSASSTYSTPSDNSRHRVWPHRSSSGDWQTSHLSPYTMSNSRDMYGQLDLGATPSSLVYAGFPASSQGATGSVYASQLDMPMATFPDESALLDQHQSHFNPSTTVRSPTPPSTSTQSAETLVTHSAVFPADRMMNPLALGRQKEVALGLLAAHALMPDSSLRIAGNAIPAYVDVYWKNFQMLCPMVHRATFDVTGEQMEVLRCAMAAMGTQYLDTKEDRIRGNHLHEYASQQARYFYQWNIPVMQAILLCEWFTRFRGRKAITRPSKQFESVYQRVSDDSIFAQIPMTGSNEERWHAWIEMESRRRILAGCFIMDAHSATYHEQPLTRTFDIEVDGIPPIPLTIGTEDLWQAPNAKIWAALVEARSHHLRQPYLLNEIDHDHLTPDTLRTYPVFDQGIVLALEGLRLPRRGTPAQLELSSQLPTIDSSKIRLATLFPDDPVAYTYLALHHTALHDLLAVSGDSWVFSQKVVQASSFFEHRKRLQQWRSSGNAAAAVVFAARALTAWFKTGHGRPGAHAGNGDVAMSDVGGRQFKDNICDYWGMYVCALICWAFGHCAGSEGDLDFVARAGDGEEDVGILWARAAASMQLGEVAELRGKKGSASVVVVVRQWLERDCLGAKSRLFVDAVRVLKNLEERANSEWF